MNELALFAGGGGGVWAADLLGHATVCAVEINESSRNILLQRQADGVFPRFPIWDDIKTFDGNPWRGQIDIVSGGFPCQDISIAGTGKGLSGERSGLWFEMARVIGEVRPRYAFIENSPMLVTRGLERVLCDLAKMGFDAEWGIVGAHHVGAPHKRERIWILAHDQRFGCEGKVGSGAHCQAWDETVKRCDFLADADCKWQLQPHRAIKQVGRRLGDCCEKTISEWTWPPESGICRVANGVADWRKRIFALGNGQVPAVAVRAWQLLCLQRSK